MLTSFNLRGFYTGDNLIFQFSEENGSGAFSAKQAAMMLKHCYAVAKVF